jgi:hypothetical protein
MANNKKEVKPKTRGMQETTRRKTNERKIRQRRKKQFEMG